MTGEKVKRLVEVLKDNVHRSGGGSSRMTGEKMKRRNEWAKQLTDLCNNFPGANTNNEADRKVTVALAMLVSSATKAGL